MNIFVTGATGVLGRSTIRLLVAEGHQVRALARREANEPTLRQLGAETVRGDLFDAPAMRAAIAGSQAVLHLATRIPGSSEMGNDAIWGENDRIRTEGTRHVVDAAIAAGVEVLVYPSVTLVYADGGDAWLSTGSPLASTRFTRTTLAAEAEIERFTAAGGRGIALRMGGFYGPEASHTQDLLAYARKGLAAVFGPADAYTAALWIDDAARAVVAALRQAPAGTYDVVDDEPLRRGEYVAALAETVGKRSLFRLPTFRARLMVDGELLELQSRSQRVSNRPFKDATGWAPEVPSLRDGLRRLGRHPVA